MEADDRFTVVVAVANPERVEQLLRTASDIAADRNGRVHLVSVVHKPVSSPFRLFEDDHITAEFSGDRAAVLDRAEAAVPDDVPVTRELRTGTDVADVLAATVQEVAADLLLLGWQDRSRPSDVVLGTTVDPLLRTAPCPVLVERVGRTAGSVDRILLPTVGGVNAGFAGEVGGSIARRNDASVTVLGVIPPDAPADRREDASAAVAAMTATLEDVKTTGRIRTGEDVGKELVAAANDHDLVVLGATRTGRIVPRTIGSVAHRVADETTQPVLIAKDAEHGGRIGSLFGRLWPAGIGP